MAPKLALLFLIAASCAAAELPVTEAHLNLVDDYTVVLPRLTPEQRVKLQEWINRRAWTTEPLGEGEQQELARTRGAPTSLMGRLVSLRRWLGDAPEARVIVDHLQREYAVNPIQTARRLDRCLATLAHGGTPTAAEVRAELPVLPVTQSTELRMKFMAPPEQLAQESIAELANGVPTWEAAMDRAVEVMSRRIKIKQTREELASLGQVLLRRDRKPTDHITADTALQRAGREQPEPHWLAWRAAACGLAGRFKEEATLLTLAREAGPKVAEIRFWNALALGRSDEPADSLAYHQEVRAVHAASMDPVTLEDLRASYHHCRVIKRGAALALEIIDGAGTGDPEPERRQAWAAAVAQDRAALVTLDLAYREVLAGEYTKLTTGESGLGGVKDAVGGLLRGITGY